MSDKKHIEFYIHYNWPPSKNSISGVSASPFNSSLQIRLMAEDKHKLGEFYTFNEIVEGFYPVDQVSKLLSDGATKGRYLTGDIFYIEVKDIEKHEVKRLKINASEKIPANASGPTHVSEQYFFEV